MKKLSFSMLAMAGLLFAGCADNDAVVGNDPKPGEVRPEGYVALNINLPTAPSSRAINDDFSDGTYDEYAVRDYALLIFEDGETSAAKGELNAPLLCVKTFTTWGDPKVDDVDNDNITTSKTAVTTISNHTPNRQLYALAVLNYGNVMNINATNNTVTLKNTDETPVACLKDLYKVAENVDLISRAYDLTTNESYFFMTNALLSTTPGGTATTAPDADNVFQLAKLDETKIFSTEEEAKKSPAGEILVERAVAKATLYCPLSLKIEGVSNPFSQVDKTTFGLHSVEWVIDNIEPTTFVARNPGYEVSGVTPNYYIAYTSEALTNNYRFVSHTSTLTNTSLGTFENYYRTYWCVDPHYNSPATTMNGYGANPLNGCNDFVVATNNTTNTTPIPLYCYENTFNVANQTYRNTTRAIIKVTVEDEPNFYTLNGSSVCYTEEDVHTYIKQIVLSNATFLNYLRGKLKPETEEITTNIAFFESHFEYILERDNGTGVCTVKELQLKDEDDEYFKGGDSSPFEEDITTELSDILETAQTDINTNLTILGYEGGVMYYEARFEHFGQELTPWNTWETDPKPTSGNTIATSYPGTNAEQNYLGRYGMVRNNWYDVEVTAFKNLGSPVDPTGKISNDNTPDDVLKDNIAVKIHVLSWAKRTQSWSF